MKATQIIILIFVLFGCKKHIVTERIGVEPGHNNQVDGGQEDRGAEYLALDSDEGFFTVKPEDLLKAPSDSSLNLADSSSIFVPLDNTQIAIGTAATVATLIGVAAFHYRKPIGDALETGVVQMGFAKKVYGKAALDHQKAVFVRQMGKNKKKQVKKGVEQMFTEIPLTSNSPAAPSTAAPHLFLGILPDEEVLGAAAKKTSSEKVSVLSAIEGWEMVSGHDKFGTIPKERSNKIIETPDYLGVSPENLKAGADFINNQIKEGRSVYVHCKSGKGRSASMVVAYLYLHRGMNLQEAINYVKKVRPEVSVNKIFGGHKAALQEFAEKYKPVVDWSTNFPR